MALLNSIGFKQLHWSLAAGLIVAVALGESGAVAKPITSQHAEIRFEAMQMDVPVEGEFKQFSADVDFDPAKPQAGKVSIVIKLASVDTGSYDADNMLKSKGFFDAGNFPEATFVSTSIAPTGAGMFRASGQFTLKGRSFAIVIPFAVSPEGAGLSLKGSVPVSRLAYNVGEGEWTDTGTLADQVLIKFKLYLPR